MKVHPNARTTPKSRQVLVERVLNGSATEEVAAQFGISLRTVYKWLNRFKNEGPRGLHDRSSRPLRIPFSTPPARTRQIEGLRRKGKTAAEIAEKIRCPPSTVSRVLLRLGLGKLKNLESRPPAVRYERSRPGELIHLDTKKLARIRKVGHRIHGDPSRKSSGVGYENAHVCIDDCTRLVYAEVLEAENQHTCTAFLIRAVRWYRKRGITVHAVMTDNGPGYISKLFKNACKDLALLQIYTRPHTPRTNGKAERFIQTLQHRWAYAKAYSSSAKRTAALKPWVRYYNHKRPHRGIGALTPFQRLRELREQPV